MSCCYAGNKGKRFCGTLLWFGSVKMMNGFLDLELLEIVVYSLSSAILVRVKFTLV